MKKIVQNLNIHVVFNNKNMHVRMQAQIIAYKHQEVIPWDKLLQFLRLERRKELKNETIKCCTKDTFTNT